MKYHFISKEFQNQYSKTQRLTQRLMFDHKNKMVFIRGIWLDKKNGKSTQYKVLPSNEQEEFNIVGEIPQIPTFKGNLPESWWQ